MLVEENNYIENPENFTKLAREENNKMQWGGRRVEIVKYEKGREKLDKPEVEKERDKGRQDGQDEWVLGFSKKKIFISPYNLSVSFYWSLRWCHFS